MRTKDLLAEEEKVLEIEAGGLLYEQYVNYIIEDKTHGSLGKIEEIIEYPQQEMAAISIKEKEVLIPLNEQLIINIDDGTKTISMDLPDGLLNLE